MTRLQAEFHRLYLPLSPEASGADSDTRALVLELARPADWERLSKAWRGVQTDLELPAPAIAVSGTDGIQLWFSLCEPVSIAQAHAFLESLRCRYLPDVAPQRVRLMPAVDVSTTPGATVHAPKVPALQGATGNWSAFVAPDLAPLFSETPWLDIPPGDDGQANLLSRLDSIKPPLFAAALAQLRAAEDQVTADKLKLETAASPVATQKRTYGGDLDPKSFLLAVMNDDGASLALRIEAAKALLPYTADVRS